jgi:hypothetical protein
MEKKEFTNMLKIRVTLDNGKSYYISEGWPFSEKFFILKEKFSDGQAYHSSLEFRVAWEIYHNKYHSEFQGIKIENPDYDFMKNIFNKYFHINPKQVVKVEAIDEHTLKKRKINMTISPNTRTPKTLRFPKDQFDMLKHCAITSSHWTYIGKKWIAFPDLEDYPKINKIHYYTRGLTTVIFEAFIYRNVRPDLRDGFYKNRRELLFNPLMQKLYLQSKYIDNCKLFTVLPIKEK